MSCLQPNSLSGTCLIKSELVSTCASVVNLNSLEQCQWPVSQAYELHASFKLARDTTDGIGGGWERIFSNIASQPISPGYTQNRACVRYVLFCVAGNSYRVLGMNPSANTQLTEAGYISLATPHLASTVAINGIKTIALEFFGVRLAYAGPGNPRLFVGSTDYYQAYRKNTF
jgi:hypothetical protein